MNDLPLFLFAFANDEQKSLKFLVEEEIKIQETLQKLHDSKQIEIRFLSYITRERLFDHISPNLNRLAVFHYGGHADGNQLELNDGTANAQGIADLLRLAENLQLVFLNGCSTVGQVKRLLELGVRRVIATSAPINDFTAVEFAVKFYESLASQKNPIGISYQAGLAFLKIGDQTAERKIGNSLTDKKNDDPIWGIYPENVEKDWKISNSINIHSINTYNKKSVGPECGKIETFTGRETEIKWLEESIFQEKKKLNVISGFTGMGKTLIANQFFYKFQERFTHCFWITIQENFVQAKDILIPEFKTLAIKWDLFLKEKESIEDQLDGIITYLNQEENKNWLCVIDNANNFSQLQKSSLLRKIKDSGTFLITTQTLNIASMELQFNQYKLDKMNKEDAVSLFYKIWGQKEEEETQKEKEIVKFIIEHELKRHPLAISVAAQYLRKVGGVSFLDNDLTLMKEKFLEYNYTDSDNHPISVLIVMQLVLNHLKNQKQSLSFLKIISFLDPNRIPIAHLKDKLEVFGILPLEMDKVNEDCMSYSLYSIERENITKTELLQINELLSDYINDSIEKKYTYIRRGIEYLISLFTGFRKRDRIQYLQGISAIFIEIMKNFTNPKEDYISKKLFIPHLEKCNQLFKEYSRSSSSQIEKLLEEYHRENQNILRSYEIELEIKLMESVKKSGMELAGKYAELAEELGKENRFILDKNEVSESITHNYNKSLSLLESLKVNADILNLKQNIYLQLGYLHGIRGKSFRKEVESNWNKFIETGIQNQKTKLELLLQIEEKLDKGKEHYQKHLEFYAGLDLRYMEEAILCDSENPEFYSIRGHAYLLLKNELSALKDFETSIQKKLNYEKGYYGIAQVFLMRNDFAEAIKYYNKAIEINPNYESPYNGLGNVYAEHKNFEEAINCYSKAIELNPDFYAAYYGLGNVYAEHKNFEEAINYYSKSIELNPDFYAAYYGLGNVYIDQKRFTEAINYYNKAIELNPNYEYPYNGLGNVYKEQNNYKEAIKYYSKAIELNPDFYAAYYGLGNVYAEQKRFVEAINYYSKSIKLNPNSEFPYNGLGNVYAQQKNFKEAVKYFNKSIELNPNYEYPYNGLGNVYEEQNNYNEAVKCYNKSIGLNPDYDTPYAGLGNIFYRQKNFKEAVKCYNKSIELNPNSELSYNGLGNVCYEQNNFNEAINYYNKSIELNPNHYAPYNGLGKVCYEQNNFKEAIKYYSKAIELNSQIPMIFQNRAISYMEIEDFTSAFQDIETALGLEPENHELYFIRALLNKMQNQKPKAMEDILLAVFLLEEENSNDPRLEEYKKFQEELLV